MPLSVTRLWHLAAATCPVAGEITNVSRGGGGTQKPATVTERKAASGTSLLNKRSEAARLSVPALCFVSPAIHYEWKVSQQNCLFSQLASRPETRALVCLSLSTLSSPSASAKEDCQMRAKKWKSTDSVRDILSFYVTQHTRSS